MTNQSQESEIKQKIAEAKIKISDLEVAASKIRRLRDLARLEDSHVPTDGQPYVYMFNQPTTSIGALTSSPNGILIPGESAAVLSTRLTPNAIFPGIIKMDGDSTFVCTDIQGVQQVEWINQGQSHLPRTGNYWAPLSRSDLGRMYSADAIRTAANANPYFCSDFGFRFIDEGTGRRLFQVETRDNNEDVFIPARFLGNGMPYGSQFGPNHTNVLDFQHVFGKNTVIKCEIKAYNSAEQLTAGDRSAINVRVFIGLIGYKVFGD